MPRRVDVATYCGKEYFLGWYIYIDIINLLFYFALFLKFKRRCATNHFGSIYLIYLSHLSEKEQRIQNGSSNLARERGH